MFVTRKAPFQIYKCDYCGLEYEEEKWAKKCAAWCREHKSCNLEIIKHSIKKGGDNNG